MAALADAAAGRRRATVQAGLPSGWRNLASGHQIRRYVDVRTDGEVEIRYRYHRDGTVDLPDLPAVSVVEVTADRVVADVAGVRHRWTVSRHGQSVFVDRPGVAVTLRRVPRFVDPSAVARPGSLLAPMPGSVIRIAVAEGDRVTAGQPLLWLEAMKMEHTVAASADGVVTTLSVQAGQQLSVGDVLAVITADDETDPTNPSQTQHEENVG
ncbi:acetyl-CoA carboxylase biotin carboxyl carrier protein subunit [Gordonia sp. OPL2]|uniref:acetyl-CoA carboxylase biotin carboxyl carrier protein subunit n=1 Tax=Gordonia sp. OPL2 TaxID=2486274 RepID=UPI0034DAD185